MKSRALLLVAGEVSGDIHGGNLLNQLCRLRGDLEPFGIGGDRLSAAGLECLARSEELSHMGLAEIVRELPSIRRVMRRVIDEAERRRPEVAVLIDSPDFNLRLARHLHRHQIPVILYVSPQLWAWRRGRVHAIRRLAHEVLCILPFEVEFYHRHGVPARYVGHPLVDDLANEDLLDRPTTRSQTRLALLPGSRAMEIESLLPAMVEGIRTLGDQEVDDVVLLEAPGMSEPVSKVLRATGSDPRLRRVSGERRRRELASCGLAWTASGTVTLECALLDVPMIVGYRLHPVTYAMARMLVRVPHVALVNLIAGERLAPELIQRSWAAANLCLATRSLLASGGTRQRASLAGVRRALGAPGASLRAAEAVSEHLG